MILFFLYITILVLIFFFVRSITAQFWFLFIGIYTVFTYGTYVFRPDLFSLINITVDGDKSTELGLFLILSVLGNFLFYVWFSRSKFISRRVVLRQTKRPQKKLFSIFYFIFGISLFTYFIVNGDKFNWGTGVNSLGSPLFAISFRTFLPLTILQLAVTSNKKIENYAYRVLALFGIILIIMISTKASSRSDLIYLFLGITTLIIYNRQISKINFILGGIILCTAALFIGQIFLFKRAAMEGNIIDLLVLVYATISDFSEAALVMLLSQDYFGPASTLIISMEEQIIVPFEAIKSNFYNLFYFVGGDTLSTIIVSHLDLSFLRGAGFAYIIYAEGYNMFGFLGFLYNGFMAGLLLHILAPHFVGVSRKHKGVLLAILSVLIMQVIRAQSGGAFKVIYSLIPVFFGFCLVFGYSVRLRRI